MADLLTPAEAAKRLRVHSRTIRRWAELGQIRSVKLPSGRIRIPEDAIAELENDEKAAS